VTPTNKMLRAYTDCTESAAFTGDWASSVVSGGSISYGTAPETSGGKYFQGIHQLSTGTTGSTNARALLTTGQGTMCFGGGVWKFIGVIKTPAALSDASNTYQIQVGFSDSATGIVDGALFYYTHSLSANWYCRTISNSTITSTDTATAVVVDTWTKFEIRVNADGSSVTFYMNDSLVATHTTNIPTGVARSLGCLTSIRRNDTNTTSRTMAVDMAYVENLHTTAR
jgi:hypothetical protein